MAEASEQALRFAENLSLPSVQVVVVSANMGCSHCQERVSRIVSKMNAGLLDYMVDMRKKEVTVRGIVSSKKRKRSHQGICRHINKKKSPGSLGLFKMMCFCAF
ncbi:uncharacterized protein LOC103707807 isoform X1 [Phoenix dactylifera]|uniref:Uncharacterized protein LOC103707807 isoform X1 n=1 Tax=Phoenix dactylifera TaxID=42345 RepID=A0A8B7C3B8_PHODC|nr:uncharacterized protein LOC103707807 isoform X1 [Phoenix dactylifera]